MNYTWIVASLVVICLIIVLNVAGPLKGTTGDDFPESFQPGNNPLPPCPGSPNCVRLSLQTGSSADLLYSDIKTILEEMGAEEIEESSQSLQLSAVFKIPLFGFRDDLDIQITRSEKNTGAVLHLSSRSRVGRGDLGINRRRAKELIRKLNNHL